VAHKVTIDQRTLDSLSEEFGPFHNSVVWADIEGSEAEMLEGARNLLASGTILGFHLEVRPLPLYDGWCTGGDVDGILKEYGYERVYRIKRASTHSDVGYIKKGS
jgi:hypothetical protein